MAGKADQWRWNEALYGGNDVLLRALVSQELPDTSLTQMAGYVNGLYQREKLLPWSAANDELQTQIERVTPLVAEVRSNLSAKEQQRIDLEFLRFVRQSGRLSVVLGAGASKAAGAPLWGKLVKKLLKFVLKTETSRGVDRKAQKVLAKIKTDNADTKDLMHGAQLCVDAYGQHLFTHMYGFLYDPAPTPGPVYDAIAELAERVGRGPTSPFGWWRIVNYNFDNLVGEALDNRGIPRVSYLMWEDKIRCASQTLRNESAPHVPVLHLHGYTPRTVFPITDERFVFSTAQYAQVYHGARVGVMKRAFEECLANPIDLALYVGCSFDDEYMNDLLREATETLPGRRHFALLQWPGRGDPLAATASKRARHEASYRRIGVQPIWFKEFREIPALIRSIAPETLR